MTTPETARTAARETPEWKATFIDLSDALPFLSGYHTNKLADAIYNAVNRSLPEPQASKASEPYTPPPGTPDIRCAMCGSGMMTRLELGRLRKRVAELEAALPSPASDRCTCDKFERGHDEHEPWCGGPAPSDHPHASIQCGWCGKQFPIPAGTVLDVNKCPECRAKDAALFHPRARQSGPSARSVSDRGRVDVEDGRGNVVMDAACPRGCSALRSARVPLPQQQEDDRSWEKECVVRANGVVSYLSTASHTGTVYLVPDGRWVTYDQWFLLTAPSDRFPSESAAREALAKAPDPRTPQASPASDQGKPCTCDKYAMGDDEHAPWCGGPSPSAPPPASEAERPKCPECGRQPEPPAN